MSAAPQTAAGAAGPGGRCRAAGCTAARLYDGLCETHLWELEHTTAYLGGPHTTPQPDCPWCPSPTEERSR